MQQTVKDWHPDEQPRERLASQGARSLTTAELVAVLLRTGTRSRNVLELSRYILRQTTLRQMEQMSVQELSEINGIGPAKAVTLMAAIELGRRYQAELSDVRPLFNTPKKVADYFIPRFGDRETEHFIAVYLNQSNRMIEFKLISSGLINETLVHPREVMRAAVRCLAAKIILIHNHPSGKCEPSQNDIQITGQIVEAGTVVGIPVVDHLILTATRHFSFKNAGLIP